MEKIRWRGREDGGRGVVDGRRERNEREKAWMRAGRRGKRGRKDDRKGGKRE